MAVGNTETGITITYDNAANELNFVASDQSATDELQIISKVGDQVALSNGGGNFNDDHLGTANQVLSGNRTVTQGNFDLNFDADTLVIDGSDNNVGIGDATPSEKLQVAGFIEAGDDGQGTVALTYNDGQGNANLTFNHTRGIPDVNGSSGRISVGVDGNSGYKYFDLSSNVTAGSTVSITENMRLQSNG